ncbi:hypothetical protein FDECE_1940 [Fusarium decemcellulare]|nr:hypothetical protein FDECE_1940 [Fusarium decemcellulare]
MTSPSATAIRLAVTDVGSNCAKNVGPNCGTSAPAPVPLPVLGNPSIITSTFDKPYQALTQFRLPFQTEMHHDGTTKYARHNSSASALVHDLCPTSTLISSACDPASTTKNTLNLNFDTAASDPTFNGHHER